MYAKSNVHANLYCTRMGRVYLHHNGQHRIALNVCALADLSYPAGEHYV